MSEQICRFCQRYVKLAYYCEECGSSCCSDCLHEERVDYLICQECNSRNIETTNSEKRKECKDCGSENIVKTNQLLKSCPKCHSHQIINIYEKKEELEKNFLELIKDTRIFISPLRQILDKLCLIQENIKKARDPPIRCYHFPKMESDLLALFKLFVYVQHTLHEKINVHFHQLVLYKEYFFDIYSQPNTNITIIEGIFENLIRHFDSIQEFLTNNVKTFNETIDSLNKNLQFIDKISSYFLSFKKLLKLAEKEKPVFAIHAKLANGLNTEDKFKKDKGILFLTNLDLSFIHEYGLIKRKYELVFKAPVQDLTRIKEKGKIFKKLYLEFAYGRYEFTLSQKAISRVIEYILLARTFDETTIYDKVTSKKLKDIDIDLNSLITFIEESINSFFSLKCQYNKGFEKVNSYQQGLPQSKSPLYQSNPQHGVKLPFSINYFPQPISKIQPEVNQGNFLHNPAMQFTQNQITPCNQAIPTSYNEPPFFLQNFNNPNRFQNYPRKIHPNNPEFIVNEYTHNNQQFPTPLDPYENQLYHEKIPFINDDNITEYNRNHLSNLFNPEKISPHRSYKYKRNLFKLDREKKEKMLELDKERYSLKETIKKLEGKFDQGLISETDYFRTFRNLQKEIYLIEKKIQSLGESLEEVETLKKTSRNFDKKRYYT